MEQYKQILDKSSEKFVYPTCNTKSFVKYFNLETDSCLTDDYGRCDRETNCSYHKAPRCRANPFAPAAAPAAARILSHGNL
jgi:hypothetical protein